MMIFGKHFFDKPFFSHNTAVGHNAAATSSAGSGTFINSNVIALQPERLSSKEKRFLQEMTAATLDDESTWPSRMLIATAIVIVIAALWAHFAIIEEITLGQGRVIPTSREQVIQSLEGGIIAELPVREGDVVNAGDVLLRIDDTRAGSSLREGKSRALALKAMAARLRAEAAGTEPVFPADVMRNRALWQTEKNTFDTRAYSLSESLSALQTGLALVEKELAITTPLANKGLVSEVELLKGQRQANELRLQIADRINRFRAEASADLVKVEAELAPLDENLVARADSLRRTLIRAPLRGTIKNVQSNTIGGVIQPGTPIMTLVPLEEKQLIEARVKPSDVAFLHEGLRATVKITAYDFSIYGALHGKVINISPDTLRDDNMRGPGISADDQAYYRVLVETDGTTLHSGHKTLPILPGMIANVEILTGHKSILDYLLKPVFKAREALRER